jgi:alpha-galactosidase
MWGSASWTALISALVVCMGCAKGVATHAENVDPESLADGGTPDAGDDDTTAPDAGEVSPNDPDAARPTVPDAGGNPQTQDAGDDPQTKDAGPDAPQTPDAGPGDPATPDAGPSGDTPPAVTASYNIVRKGSNKCLDVTGGSADDGAKIIQYWCNGAVNQRFRIEMLTAGQVRFVDQSSQKCLDVDHSGTADGTQLQLWTCNDTAAQAFTIEDLENGYAQLRNVNSQTCIDVNGASNEDGAKVQIYGCSGGDAQSFQFRAPPGDPGDPAAPLYTSVTGATLTMTTGNVRIDYDLSAGTADFFYAGHRKLTGFYAGVQLQSYLTSRDYTSRTYATSSSQVVVTSTGAGLPTMQQIFNLSGGHRFLARVVLLGDDLSTNWIAPVVVSRKGGVNVGLYNDPRVLWVPFDNDAWVNYNAASINGNTGTSFEAAAFYDNDSRNGIVVGSVLHDTWKTGIYYSGEQNRLDVLNVFGGATDATWTHDKVAHAKVTGDALYSPFVFVGYGPDYRDLMEEFADVNALYEPKLPWSGGVPFGWNSWGKVQTKLTYGIAVSVSDFFKSSLTNQNFENQGTVYINLDSYWDNMSDAQLAQFVAHARANGQKAGIYWAPFVDWGNSARPVENSSYNYEQLWLRDDANQPIQLAGANAIDPTHPGTKARIDYFIDRFKTLGFEYLKLDFLTHGALESSVRHSQSARTGIQAYNEGMAYLRDRIAGTMFISASIAPLFPHKYADHLVFEGFSPEENMSRLLSGVVSGTVFLNGDDLTNPVAQNLARTYLTNGRINDVARLGRPFRPVEGNTGTSPSELMVLTHGVDTYLAVFNFSGDSVTRNVDLGRAGLDASRTYDVTDLWTGDGTSAKGTLAVSLARDYARLFVLR